MHDEEIVHGLEAAVRDITARPAEQVVAEVNQRRHRRRRHRRVAASVSATVALAVAAAGVAGLARSDRPDELVVAPSTEGRGPSATTGAPPVLEQPEPDELRRAWRTLPAGPLGERLGFASAWTGSELVIWGGWGGRTEAPGEPYFSDGAAYDPASGTWRTLAPAPGSGRGDAKAVWTGDEVVVLGGRDANGILSDGLAYDPAADTWRMLEEGPLGTSIPGDAVWTGSEIVLATLPSGDIKRTGPERILTFDPSTGEWGRRSDPPVEFTGADLVVAGDRLLLFSTALDELSSATRPGVDVAEWDPESREWMSLPTLADPTPQAFVAEEVSGSLIAVDHRQNAFVSPADDVEWSGPSKGPLDPIECPPEAVTLTGSLFFWQCGQAALVGTDSRWINVSPPDLGTEMPWDTTVVTDGDHVLIWGRDFDTRQPVFLEFVISAL